MTTTVYWAGGEDATFGSTTVECVGGGNATYRSAYARGSMLFQGSPYAPPFVYPLTSYSRSPVLSLPTAFWFHAQFGAINPASNGMPNNSIWVTFYDNMGIPRIAIRGGGAAGQIKISTVNAAGAFTDLVTSAAGAFNWVLPNPNPTAVDIFVNYSTSGQVQVNWNGVPICDTGTMVNVVTDSATACAQVAVAGGMNDFSGWGWSEFVICNTDTRGFVVQTLPPVATGNTQTWTGSVSNINSLTVDFSVFNSTLGANEISEWTVSTALPTGNWEIIAVAQSAAMSRGTTGPQNFAWDVRVSAGISYQSGSQALTAGDQFVQFVWMTNPNTMVAWNAGELIDSGVESLA